MSCPCGSTQSLKECCEPFIQGAKLPATAEELMRSRYTAYTLVEIGYIKKTLAPESRKDFDEGETKRWAKEAKWKGLKILSTKKGQETDTKGVVEFSVAYELEDQDLQLHETSDFRKDPDGVWYFVDGDSHVHPAGEEIEHSHASQAPVIRTETKIGRNDPCPCGSGMKFKKCCEA